MKVHCGVWNKNIDQSILFEHPFEYHLVPEVNSPLNKYITNFNSLHGIFIIFLPVYIINYFSIKNQNKIGSF